MTALKLFVERGYHETKITDIASSVPMSTGLMFHYFESKEELLIELVKMGATNASAALISGPARGEHPEDGQTDTPQKKPAMADIPGDVYLTGFLRQMFEYAEHEPWVFNMFILMGQARRGGMPEEARQIANSMSTTEFTASLIKAGQKKGIFHKGDPEIMAECFWAAVQGIMEEMAMNREMKAPDPEWIVAMLK